MSVRANPVATLFPLLLLGLLAGLSYWLELASRSPAGADDGKTRHDPDYIVGSFVAKRFDTDGNLQHSLSAEELRHFPDDDSSLVTAPRLTYHRDPATTVSARTAHIGSKSEHVQLIDDVRIVRSGIQGKEDSVLATQQLDTWPDAEVAKSVHPVTMTQGRSIIQGSGFSMDGKVSYFILEGPVRGVFFRNDKTTKASSQPRTAQAPAKSAKKVRAKPRALKKPTRAR